MDSRSLMSLLVVILVHAFGASSGTFSLSLWSNVPTGYRVATINELNSYSFSHVLQNLVALLDECLEANLTFVDTGGHVRCYPGAANEEMVIRRGVFTRSSGALCDTYFIDHEPHSVSNESCTIIVSEASTVLPQTVVGNSIEVSTIEDLTTTDTPVGTLFSDVATTSVTTPPTVLESTASGSTPPVVLESVTPGTTPPLVVVFDTTIPVTTPLSMFVIRLLSNASFEQFINFTSPLYAAAVGSLTADLAALLSVPTSAVRVTNLKIGSLLVMFEVSSATSTAELQSSLRAIETGPQQLPRFRELFYDVTGTRTFEAQLVITSSPRVALPGLSTISTSTVIGTVVGSVLILSLFVIGGAICMRARKSTVIASTTSIVPTLESSRSDSIGSAGEVTVMLPG